MNVELRLQWRQYYRVNIYFSNLFQTTKKKITDERIRIGKMLNFHELFQRTNALYYIFPFDLYGPLFM